MKKLLSLLLLLNICCLKAQDYLGFVNSNYSGITGAIINPANLADNRLKFDLCIVGLNLNAANNYIGIKRGAFKHDGSLISAIRKTMNGENGFPAFGDS